MIYSYVYYAYAVSVQLTSAKVERILELCKFTLVHLCVFLIFCVIILHYAVEKLQSKGEETVWKGFCILTRELTHPYESVSISLCNLRSTSLNVRSTPLNVRSEPLNGGFRGFERRNDKDAETNSLWFTFFSLWFSDFS